MWAPPPEGRVRARGDRTTRSRRGPREGPLSSMTRGHAKHRRIVVAFGGNALVRHGEDGTQRRQIHHAEGLARSLVKILKKGHDLVLVHGNGPQVGNLLVQVEEAITKVPPVSLDLCVAQTGGSIGYMLE